MMRLIRNAVKCNWCGDVIESKHVYDMKYCSCQRVGVDGGHEYDRVMFMEETDFEPLYEWATVDVEGADIKPKV